MINNVCLINETSEDVFDDLYDKVVFNINNQMLTTLYFTIMNQQIYSLVFELLLNLTIHFKDSSIIFSNLKFVNFDNDKLNEIKNEVATFF